MAGAGVGVPKPQNPNDRRGLTTLGQTGVALPIQMIRVRPARREIRRHRQQVVAPRSPEVPIQVQRCKSSRLYPRCSRELRPLWPWRPAARFQNRTGVAARTAPTSPKRPPAAVLASIRPTNSICHPRRSRRPLVVSRKNSSSKSSKPDYNYVNSNKPSAVRRPTGRSRRVPNAGRFLSAFPIKKTPPWGYISTPWRKPLAPRMPEVLRHRFRNFSLM